jgi:hypothetical protein
MAEARLYMNLEPCPACDHRGFDAQGDLVEHGDDLAVTSRGYCPACGVERRFDLLLGESLTRGYGGAEPSTLIDAGEWLDLADQLSRAVPADPTGLDAAARARGGAQLEQAIAAVDEVVKFIGDGEERAPRTSFFTARGKEVYLREPGRFERRRLEAVQAAWRELAQRFGKG